jgi:tRNA pseudouridine55 synthase
MISGVINVRKEKGMTSFDVVAIARGIFKQKKIGHTGTLDPDAEGVLPVCLGRATRLVDRLSHGTKTYEAVMLLGVTTDTQDVSGKILASSPVSVTEEEARTAVLSFIGKGKQIPPMYSAIKINGRKLVDLARKGIELERPARDVEFFQITVLNISLPRVTFSVTCSHGTYIRTLCHDIGQKLKTGAAMESLIRTRVEEFSLEDALTLKELQQRKEEEDLNGSSVHGYSFVQPVDRFFGDLPVLCIPDKLMRTAENGGKLPLTALPEGTIFSDGAEIRAYAPDGRFVGIYRLAGDHFRLLQYFYDPGE